MNGPPVASLLPPRGATPDPGKPVLEPLLEECVAALARSAISPEPAAMSEPCTGTLS